jgi:hypothetical protein
MEWPYRRFIKAFDAFQRRLICDELRARRVAHIAALHANTNLDDKENDRPKIVGEVERAYEQLIADAWNGTTETQRIEESGALDTGFMRASQRAAIPVLPGEKVIGALP